MFLQTHVKVVLYDTAITYKGCFI